MESTPEIKELDLGLIVIDPALQPRVAMSEEVIDDYAEDMRNGDQFPAIKVVWDGVKYYVTDGFHRYRAARRANLLSIQAEVTEGSYRDALYASLTANKNNGLHRTNEDKRKAVTTWLNDPEWAAWSDQRIARELGVSHTFVGKVREELSGNGFQINTKRTVVRGGKEYQVDTSNISTSNTQRPAGWVRRWQDRKQANFDIVQFVQPSHRPDIWIAMEGDAVKVSRLLGLDRQKFTMPGDAVPKLREAIKLIVPEPKPAWFDAMYAALKGNIDAYLEGDTSFAMFAERTLSENIVGEVTAVEPPELPAPTSEPESEAAPTAVSQFPGVPKPGVPAPTSEQASTAAMFESKSADANIPLLWVADEQASDWLLDLMGMYMNAEARETNPDRKALAAKHLGIIDRTIELLAGREDDPVLVSGDISEAPPELKVHHERGILELFQQTIDFCDYFLAQSDVIVRTAEAEWERRYAAWAKNAINWTMGIVADNFQKLINRPAAVSEISNDIAAASTKIEAESIAARVKQIKIDKAEIDDELNYLYDMIEQRKAQLAEEKAA